MKRALCFLVVCIPAPALLFAQKAASFGGALASGGSVTGPVGTPAPAPAVDCLPATQNGNWVPFTMVMLKNYKSGGSQWASYITGALTIFNGTPTGAITLNGSNGKQLFSDRTFNLPASAGFSGPVQLFDQSKSDLLGVSVARTAAAPAAITVTLTLQSWGNGKSSFTATCDPTTGELVGSSGGNAFVAITFGTPMAQLP